MPKVKFLRDFQGKATREVFYKKGQEVELDDSLIGAVVAEGAAEYVRATLIENVTGVELQYFDNEPQFENAAEPPKPTRKRGRK